MIRRLVRAVVPRTDLGLLVALSLAATAALLVPGVPWPVEWALGIPFVLLGPGYGLVAVAFPRGPTDGDPESWRRAPPGWPARLGMALVLSALVVGFVAAQLSRLQLIRLAPVVASLAVLNCGLALLARFRRGSAPAAPSADPLSYVSLRGIGSHLGTSGPQTFALGIATLVLVGSIAFAATAPAENPSYSEAALVTGEGGEVLGADGEVTLTSGQPNAVHLLVENQEGQSTTYRFVGRLQRVGSDGTVQAAEPVDRGQVTLGDGERTVLEREVTPPASDDALRLQYLVYTGQVPADPTAENADYALRVWVQVEGG
jgi:uncharacterized membrane protein